MSTISQQGIDLVKRFEGVRLRAYLDSVNVPTIGVGHTRGVRMGDVITEEQADTFLREDLNDAEEAVNDLISVTLSQGQFDALVSFVFNLGCGAFKRSTLLKHLNAGDYLAAAGQFPRWSMAGGRVLQGLVERRYAERALFMGLEKGGEPL